MTSFICGSLPKDPEPRAHGERFSDCLVETDGIGVYFCIRFPGAEIKWPVAGCSLKGVDSLIRRVNNGKDSLYGKGVCIISIEDLRCTVALYMRNKRLHIDVDRDGIFTFEIDLDAPAKRSLLHALENLKRMACTHKE